MAPVRQADRSASYK